MATKKRLNKKKMFLEVFKDNAGNISQTCEAVGINRRTFYHWIDKDEKFREVVKEVEEGLIDFVESKLMMNIKEGKETSMIFFLKTKGKHRGYVEKTEVEHSGGLEVPPVINVKVVKNED